MTVYVDNAKKREVWEAAYQTGYQHGYNDGQDGRPPRTKPPTPAEADPQD